MGKRKKIEPWVDAIEQALDLGRFISYNQSWDFVHDLEEVKGKIDALVEQGEAQNAVGLYEIFISGCYEKAEEIDDSGGNLGMFAQSLFISWLKARQKAKYRADETVKYLLNWIKNDNYGFCYKIEKDVAQNLNKEGFLLFRKHFQDQFDAAFAPFKDQDPKYISDYPSEVYRAVDVLKEIYIAKKDVKSYLVFCEAIIASPKDCENIAKLYRAKGRFSDALAWIEKGLALENQRQWGNHSTYGLDDMKRELLGKLGRKEEALESAWSDFQKHPGVYRYTELMKYIPKKDSRQWHQKAMQQAKKGELSDFIELCVKTKELEMLSGRIDLAKHEELERIGHYVTENAAKALAKRHIPAAAKIYRALGMRIIKSGKSKYYQYALEHFREARKLYEKSGQNRKWSAIVGNVRKNHSRKYSFIGDFEDIVSDKKPKTPDSFESKAKKRWK